MKKYGCYLIVFLLIFSCRKKEDKLESSVIIGELEVDLNANENHIRTQEALIGNFICDAIKVQLEDKEELCDFVMINAGAIRFDVEKRSSGIYTKGPFTSEMVDEMLPFSDNFLVKVTLIGSELKQILERSVAQLPLDKGAFMQFSSSISITVDPTQQAQIIDETVSPPQLVSEGNRIVSVQINGEELQLSKEYTLVTLDYIAKGNDGYVTFLSIPEEKTKSYPDLLTNIIRDYVTVNSPINPVISGRINF